MRILSVLNVAAFFVFPVLASAQSDTAHHRAVYNAVNESEKSLKKVIGSHKDEPTVFALTGWMKGSELLKIEAKCSDDGAGIDEFYLENEKPLFVFSTYNKVDENGKAGVRVENRLYFKDGEIFKFLTSDKAMGPLHGEDYEAETERLTTNCANFVAALKGKAGAKAVAAQVTEGVFVGIEEGDYFHWNMQDKTGNERSFFILKPDASVDKVLGKPESYAGKKCRVTWKKSMETITEAGGKMEVEQILRVEWLGGK